jgi:hypothetical protein
MDNQEVKHITVNGKYRIVLERAASTKGVIGYKIEANGDAYSDVLADIYRIQESVEIHNPAPAIEVK